MISDFYMNVCNNYLTSTKQHQNWLFIRIKCFNLTFMYFYSMKQFEIYIFLKIGFFTKNMNFALWRLFKDRDQQRKLYRMCVQNFKIIHQILLMLCKINAKYERNILIKLWKPFSPLFSLKIVILSEIQLRYIDTVFLGRPNHDNQINAKFEKNLVHYIEFHCLLLNEWEYIEKCLKFWLFLRNWFLWTITTSFTTHLHYSFAEIYLCELNILLTFHYLIFKSEHDFNIKWRQ